MRFQGFFQRSKPFDAVKCPQFAIKKNSLFCLLGPNGAGKTTTINVLTGILPPTSGEALIYGETVTHPSGMAKIRQIMGVCPQFDILWPVLTAREHMEVFGAIKGLPRQVAASEGIKKLEEVRLTEDMNNYAGSYSGGMKRRLSCAIALLGNPKIIFLDEPTTGMDPVSRRQVWDVIESVKRERCVVLTTHSMEEADILGDTIGIMAKGRLRCIGNSVHLKSKFGAGYEITVMAPTASLPEVKQLFNDEFKPSDPRSSSIQGIAKTICAAHSLWSF
jgi:ABC-type multidrug transport system ATPase subunit